MSPHEPLATEPQILLAVVKTLILVTGATVTYFSFKAFRRTQDPSLGLLALGFGLITLGTFLAGLTFEVIGAALGVGILIESVLVLAGLVVILYSLRTD